MPVVSVKVPPPPVVYGPSCVLLMTRRGSRITLSTSSPRISWMLVEPPVEAAKPNLNVAGGLAGSGALNSSVSPPVAPPSDTVMAAPGADGGSMRSRI